MPEKYYTCDCCGKQFIPHPSTIKKLERGEQKTLACSRECASKLKRHTIITYCDCCGKEIERKKSHYERQQKLGQHQFCSQKCEMEFHHKETYETRQCEICGKEFECPKISFQRFCSIQCQGKWQTLQVGDLNPRSTKIHQKCDWCGKDYLMQKYKVNTGGSHFCSDECRRNWYSNVVVKTEEFKEKSTKRAVKILSDGLMPFVYTKPQLAINSILEDMGIKYQNDYNATYYAIDNYLEESGLMIEVMGDYWHSNPLVFSYDKLNDTQLNRIPRDKAKHTYILNTYGIETLYLWENDIMNNSRLCEQLIRKYIDNNGILENYNSFNYHLDDDGILSLNSRIIYPYFDNTYVYKLKQIS